MQGLLRDLLVGFDWFVLWYFAALNLFYLYLLRVSYRAARRYEKEFRSEDGVELPEDCLKPFSIFVPAYNEEVCLVQTIESLCSMNYPEYEVIVCNDGSSDGTLNQLKERFKLEEVNVEIPDRFEHQPIRRVFFSSLQPRLVVVDKVRGGKPDAINAAACMARYGYLCTVDADSMLSDDSMRKLMQRFVGAPKNVGIGGIVRVLNGTTLQNGQVKEIHVPKKWIEKIQVVEYLRSFLFGRLGWSDLNILMIISGAFLVLRRDVVERVGGWRETAIGEDIDIVLRLQRMIKEEHLDMRLSFAPDPVCWTQVPSNIRGLVTQRDRWHRALIQAITGNMRMFFNPRYSRLGFVGLPYFFFFEMLGPVIEFLGYLAIIASLAWGIIGLKFVLMFMGVALLWGVAISFASLAMAESSYGRYTGPKELPQLFTAGILENFGFRQLNTFARFRGTLRYLFGKRSDWGRIQRTRLEEVPPSTEATAHGV